MSDCFAPDDVIRHAGLVMAQAMNIASVLNVDELICPFAVTKGDSLESIDPGRSYKGWADRIT